MLNVESNATSEPSQRMDHALHPLPSCCLPVITRRRIARAGRPIQTPLMALHRRRLRILRQRRSRPSMNFLPHQTRCGILRTYPATAVSLTFRPRQF
jgi:hypothetical protein